MTYEYFDIHYDGAGTKFCLLDFRPVVEGAADLLTVHITMSDDEYEPVAAARVAFRCEDGDGNFRWREVDEPAPEEIVRLLHEDPECIGAVEHCHSLWAAECERSRGEP